MLTGSVFHQIDEKGRFRIPAMFKEALGLNPVITRGSSGCLFILPKEEADRIMSGVFDGDETLADTPRTRAMRMLAASAFTLEEDKQGRVLLPQSLIKLAGIVKNIVINGAGRRVELWSEERWNEYLAGDMTFDESLTKSVTEK